MSNITFPNKVSGDQIYAEDINEIKDAVNSKVDIEIGKSLSTNDYTNEDKLKLQNLSSAPTSSETKQTILNKLGVTTLTGANTGDQDLSGKVDKVDGKGLSTNDYTNAEKAKVAKVEQDVMKPSHAFADSDFITDGTTVVNGQAIPLIKVNPLILGGTGSTPAPAETTSTIKTKLGVASTTTDGYLKTEDYVKFNSKADRVNGVIPVEQLPEAKLSPDQFELLYDGTIGIKLSYLQSLGLGTGTPGGGTDTTPAPPTITADDSANTLSASHALGVSEIVMSVNGNPFVAYSGPISVGDNARAAGYWRFKIKSATGRTESAVANSPAFTQLPTGNTTPAAPTLTANDVSDTLTAAHALGTSEIVVSENNGAYVPYTPITVGNVARAAGYWKFKIKSATGRNESAVVNSPAFTLINSDEILPISTWVALEGFDVVAGTTNSLESKTTNAYGFAHSDRKLPAGGTGLFQFDIVPGENTPWVALSSGYKVNKRSGTFEVGLKFAGDTYNFIDIDSFGVNWLGEFQHTYINYNSKVRIRANGQTLFFDYKNASDVWVEKSSHVQPQVDLYIKVYSDVAQNGKEFLRNVEHQGFYDTSGELISVIPPSIVANDITNTLLASHELGTSEIVVSEDGGAYLPYAPIKVGNVDRPAAYWKFKVKAATGRAESTVISSPPFYAAVDDTLTGVTNWDFSGAMEKVPDSTNSLVAKTTTAFAWGHADMKLLAGAAATIQFNILAAEHSLLLGFATGYKVNNSPAEWAFRFDYNKDSQKVGMFANNVFTADVDYLMYVNYDTIARVRATGTTVYLDVMNQAGEWIKKAEAAQPQVDLYLKAYAYNNNANTHFLRDVKQQGLVAPSYTVDKEVRLNLASQWTAKVDGAKGFVDLIANDNIIGTPTAVFDQINTFNGNPSGYTIKVTGAFSGHGNVLALTETTSEFPLPAINSAWQIENSTPNSAITIEGLNPAKFYQISILVANNQNPSSATKVTIGDAVQVVNAYENIPTTASLTEDNSLMKFRNIKSDASGNLTMKIELGDTWYNTCINAIIIQETPVAKV